MWLPVLVFIHLSLVLWCSTLVIIKRFMLVNLTRLKFHFLFAKNHHRYCVIKILNLNFLSIFFFQIFFQTFESINRLQRIIFILPQPFAWYWCLSFSVIKEILTLQFYLLKTERKTDLNNMFYWNKSVNKEIFNFTLKDFALHTYINFNCYSEGKTKAKDSTYSKTEIYEEVRKINNIDKLSKIGLKKQSSVFCYFMWGRIFFIGLRQLLLV